ncbi:hypothetical protein OPV22_024305 [Ensete ventricosum]|uniref:Large ribosomal subunit protein uL4m n=1 Tax=Ensete ventricosum TaxID=4639 RepID=A0AAV8QU19_ENSVE|nr:hypothetical protein OPV22_024305 [Ensete ventricosum]
MGTHSTKTISEVSGTGKKRYRQKGTGRARHWTLRGPQPKASFRGFGSVPSYKTKNIVNYVAQMENKKKVLCWWMEEGPIDEQLKLATRNLQYVNVLPSIGLNVYSIVLHDNTGDDDSRCTLPLIVDGIPIEVGKNSCSSHGSCQMTRVTRSKETFV